MYDEFDDFELDDEIIPVFESNTKAAKEAKKDIDKVIQEETTEDIDEWEEEIIEYDDEDDDDE
jgi:hypothetical protein